MTPAALRQWRWFLAGAGFCIGGLARDNMPAMLLGMFLLGALCRRGEGAVQ